MQPLYLCHSQKENEQLFKTFTINAHNYYYIIAFYNIFFNNLIRFFHKLYNFFVKYAQTCFAYHYVLLDISVIGTVFD